MTAFNIPKDKDEWITINLIILIVIGFTINVYSNGKACLIFIENEYNIKPGDPNYYLTDQYKTIQKYSQQTTYRNDFILWINLFLYFILIPFVNFYYGFKIFKKDQWKSDPSISYGK